MATAETKFRIDVNIHNLLQDSKGQNPRAAEPKGLTLPVPVFPQYPEKLNDPGPERAPEGNRKWGVKPIYRAMRGWLLPYVRSRVLPGDFHPITSYLFVEYKCNLDCWYCWSFDNRVKGMTEDVARRSIDWLHDHGCRVLACMGGEPLLRPDFIHKVVNYAAKKGFWVYIATNGRLLRPNWPTVWERRSFNIQLRPGLLGAEAQPSQSIYPRADKPGTHFAQAIRLRLPCLFQYQHLPKQPRRREDAD